MRSARAILTGATLLIATLIATPAFAQQFTGHGTIAGTVIDAADNQPVRKAIVTLQLNVAPRNATATARTDDAGHFRFDSLPPGRYSLTALKGSLGIATYGADAKQIRKKLAASFSSPTPRHAIA